MYSREFPTGGNFLFFVVCMMSLFRLPRGKLAFAQRSGAMKAPVGLLSDRTVLRSKMESIHNYLTYLRMQHCRKALEEGVSVLNACTESDFPDYSSFLKTFRRLYGITPAEYSAQHRTMVR